MTACTPPELPKSFFKKGLPLLLKIFFKNWLLARRTGGVVEIRVVYPEKQSGYYDRELLKSIEARLVHDFVGDNVFRKMNSPEMKVRRELYPNSMRIRFKRFEGVGE